jgi:AraC family transcriptional regulator, arabinose operon regulatory protein
MYMRHGFPGERLHVLPRPLVREALDRAPTSNLLVTDAGYFPHAARHGRIRPRGSQQAIVIMCSDGAGWCELDRQRQDIYPGQFLIIPPRAPHSYYADAVRPWSIWWLHVTGSDLPALLGAIGLTANSPVARLIDPPRAFSLVESVCDDLAADETSASLTAAAGGAWNLLARLASERSRRSGDHEPIQRVQVYLRENLDAATSVAELADMSGFSVSHFSARFRSVTGYTATEYIKRLRMARARTLLITTDEAIAEVAIAVGYSDPFYFSRQFAAVHHVSPRGFRAKVNEERLPSDHVRD